MLASGLADGEALDLFVLDFQEAFWQVPLSPAERRFFSAALLLGGVRKFVAYLRTAQGSRGAPNTWARVAALIMRLTQSVIMQRASLTCYVDDPLAVIKGTMEQRRQTAALIIYIWRALGLPLPLDKGQFGPEVVWIGGVIRVDKDGVTASIIPSLITDINELLIEFLGGNLISLKKLHTFVGKVNNGAGLFAVFTPVLAPIVGSVVSP